MQIFSVVLLLPRSFLARSVFLCLVSVVFIIQNVSPFFNSIHLSMAMQTLFVKDGRPLFMQRIWGLHQLLNMHRYQSAGFCIYGNPCGMEAYVFDLTRFCTTAL